MTVVQFDPNQWLLTLTRAIGSFVEDRLDDPDTNVEMSFPDTSSWTKTTPLQRSLIHFENDDIRNPILGFGTPAVRTYNDVDGTVQDEEVAMHLVNFDVGVWTSAQSGGTTKRMVLVDALINLFSTVTGKQDFNEATNGLWPVSFNGGGFQLDRINDVPIWRAMGMTLIVRAFSRHVPETPDTQIVDFDQSENLTIDNPDGTDSPVITP